MPFESTRISLKGFFLDPVTTTVGGTRNIFNNGIMCAKIYLGFSYNNHDDSTDTTSVQDIVNWLLANGELRAAAGNKTDSGAIEDIGWNDFGDTDPNEGEYLYDTKVLVTENQEVYDQLPGDAVWHLEYYLRVNKNNTTPVNVYYRAIDQTLTTLNDALMSIIPASRDLLNKDDFSINTAEIVEEEGNGDGSTGAVLRELNYNSSYDSSLYGLKSFYKIYPDTANQNDSHIPYDASPKEYRYGGSPAPLKEKSLYVIFTHNVSNGSRCTICVYNKFTNLNRLKVNSAYDTYNAIHGADKNYYSLEGDAFQYFNTDTTTLKGIPMGYFYMKWFYVWEDGNVIDDEGKAEVINFMDNDDNTPSIYVRDSFGSEIKLDVHVNENDSHGFEWAIKRVALE